MYEKFRVVGLSYRLSPLEMREMVSLGEGEINGFIRTLNEILGLEEVMVISTCNRTEIYYSHETSKKSEIISMLLLKKGNPGTFEIKDNFRELSGLDAVEHLYRVSLGLDAKVLGDIQISSQIKRAYQASADEQLAGPFLHRLMHSVFFANKRVSQETAFRDGAASTSYASVELTEQFIANFKEARVLILGLGEIGQDVAGNMFGTAAKVTVANRSAEKAEMIAQQYLYEALPYEEALSSLQQYDVIISSVATENPVITVESFDLSKTSMKMLIDLSVPRSIDHMIESIPGFLLYNIDQIEDKTGKIHQQREASIPEVEKIMHESIADLENWSQEMEVSPVIKKFKQALEDIRQEELARFLKNSDEQQAKLLDKVTKSMLQKVIKLPVLQLKAACKRGDADNLVDVLNDLFDLEKDTEKALNQPSESTQK
jgi:glutamyl-tRNA reductase